MEADTPEAAVRACRDRQGVLCPTGDPDQDGGDPFADAIIDDADGLLVPLMAYPAERSDLRRWREREEDEAEDDS